MRIEILTEDISGSYIVEILARQICKSAGVRADFYVRPHGGCGHLPEDWNLPPKAFTTALLDQLPAKCRAYNKIFADTDMILIVVMDSDSNDPDLLRQRLSTVCRKYAPGIKNVVGLATEEIESWLMGDLVAIKKAYPNIDENAYYEYKQDSVCGTWEALCRTVCPDNAESVLEIGYPAIGNYKSRWAKNISRYMRADKNRSPSFNRFRMSLISALRNTESNFENAVEPTLNSAPVTTDDGENHKVRRTTF